MSWWGQEEFQGEETHWGNKSCRVMIEVPKLRRN